MLHNREVVEAFFDEQSNNTVAVKNEVGSACGAIAYHAEFHLA